MPYNILIYLARFNFLRLLICLILICSLSQIHGETAKSDLPNIIVILADDLGYGDLGCYNPKSKIETPNIDSLATSGMLFTDAHSPSSLCSPTRYGLLTGRYAWRTRLKQGVMWAWEPPLIDENRLTIASMLKEQGYYTACFDKWHLGVGWNQRTTVLPDQKTLATASGRGPEYRRIFDYGRNVDWSNPICKGPTDVGFDYYFGVINGQNTPPYTWIENKKVLNAPTGFIEIPKNEIASDHSNAGIAPGVAAPGWNINSVVSGTTRKMREFILQKGKLSQPFFMYYASPAVHNPLTPGQKFKGKSKVGLYGDFVMELDWTVGILLGALSEIGELENTLIVFTSDNGPEGHCHARKSEYDHFSSYYLKGCKRDNWEGGHRVPFIASWPGQIPKGTTNDNLLCLTDLAATFAELTNYKLPANAAEDSFSAYASLRGTTTKPIRKSVIHHSARGEFAIRSGDWKLLFHGGSGGSTYKKKNGRVFARGNTEVVLWPGVSGNEPYNDSPAQLYNLKEDIYESRNLVEKYPEIVKRLNASFLCILENGRSNPGPKQKNDPVDSWPQIDKFSKDSRE